MDVRGIFVELLLQLDGDRIEVSACLVIYHNLLIKLNKNTPKILDKKKRERAKRRKGKEKCKWITL